ncbi:MAG: putative glycosyl hydrolase domain [Gemmatimonadetes bacterium]|nr:putative glycosyl hydrolase domain [Gemmatimonadota bacterium]
MTIQHVRSAAAVAVLALLAACGSGDKPGASNAPAGGDSSAAAAPSPSAQGGAAPAGGMPGGDPRSVTRRMPAQIRGIYLNAYAIGRQRLPAALKIADETEINTLVVDVKDERGMHYRSGLGLQMQLANPKEVTLTNLKAFTDTLHAHHIFAIARIVVFKDPVLSKARPDWSIRNPSGGLWADKKGNTWVSAWDPNVWDYNIAIAEEVAKLGFDMIQFDYVRFPEPYRSLPDQVHPHAQGARTDAIAAFLNRAKARLHPLGVPVAADVFGLTPNDPGDVGIGQQWETIASTADVVEPMMYPSHYLPTHLPGVPHPNRMPYETLFKSAGMAVLRTQALQQAGLHTARNIPWLQAFSAPWVDHNFTYGPEQLRQQVRGVYDVGLNDWILWSPGSKYGPFVPGLARETRSMASTSYSAPADVRSTIAMFERQGVAEARRKAVQQAHGNTTDRAAADSARTGKASPTSTSPAGAEAGTTAPAQAAPPAKRP